MKLGYNTNGLAFHRLRDAVALLAETGYESVALSVDHCCLDPYSPRLENALAEMRSLLDRFGLASVIETGARYLLNPRIKHEPILLSPSAEERAVRIDFLRRCIDIAAALDSQAVSFWSGRLRDPIDEETAWQRLTEGCREVIDHAAQRSVRLAFEPEPDMFIDTLARYAELLDRIDAPGFGLTIDIGHLHCNNEGNIADLLRTWKDRLRNIHIEDMCRGVHEHLRFGDGDIDFPPVIAALREIEYTGGVHVELSRHSHMAPVVVRESFEFLQSMMT